MVFFKAEPGLVIEFARPHPLGLLQVYQNISIS